METKHASDYRVHNPARNDIPQCIGSFMQRIPAGALLAILLFSLLLFSGCTGTTATQSAESGITVTDSLGNIVHLDAPASRIVSLNSDATEMLIALGAGNSIVGVTDTTLKNAQLAPLIPNAVSVGSWDAPNLEQILGLNPDAIISYSGYRLKNADQFERAKIPVIYIDCNRLSTLRSDATTLGRLTGHAAAAEKYNLFFDKWVGYSCNKTASTDMTRVYVEGYSEYMAQGPNSSINDMIVLERGDNIAGDEGKSYMKVTPEWLILEDPAVIIKVAPDPLPEGKTLDSYQAQVAGRPALADVDAVRNGTVYAINGKVVVGPRSPAGLPIVGAILHPEAFAGTDIMQALDEYSRDFVPGANTSQAVTPVP